MCIENRVCRCELHDELLAEEKKSNPNFREPKVKKAWLKKFFNKGTRYSVMGVCELCEEFVSERLMPIDEAERIRDNAKPRKEVSKPRKAMPDFSEFENTVRDFLKELGGGKSPLAVNDTNTCSFRDCDKKILRITYRHAEVCGLCSFHASASEEARYRAKRRRMSDTTTLATYRPNLDESPEASGAHGLDQ